MTSWESAQKAILYSQNWNDHEEHKMLVENVKRIEKISLPLLTLSCCCGSEGPTVQFDLTILPGNPDLKIHLLHLRYAFSFAIVFLSSPILIAPLFFIPSGGESMSDVCDL